MDFCQMYFLYQLRLVCVFPLLLYCTDKFYVLSEPSLQLEERIPLNHDI